MCTYVQPEFRLLIIFDHDSIRFGKNNPFSLFFLVALVLSSFEFCLLCFVFSILCFVCLTFVFCLSCFVFPLVCAI